VASTQAAEPNELEPHILMSLTEYLGYFGYRLFRGFRFAKLQAPPDWRLFRKAAHRSSFRSDGLLEMPGFRPTPQAVTPKGEGLCRFEHLGAVPSFRLCSKKGDKRER
jgi:hypothetical protein